MTDPYLSEPGNDAPLIHVTAEVWALAADHAGIWLLGRWPSLPITTDTDPHTAAELELITHGAFAEAVMLHSTSWRSDGPAMVTTYLAVVDCPGPVREHWPEALPVSLALAEIVGRPPTHGPLEPPRVPYYHVLMHGLRHLRYLTDPTMTVVINPDTPFEETLIAPADAIAFKFADPTDGARWLYTEEEIRQVEAEDPTLVVRAQHSDGFDATVALSLPGLWSTHLETLRPAIARMYDRAHGAA